MFAAYLPPPPLPLPPLISLQLPSPAPLLVPQWDHVTAGDAEGDLPLAAPRAQWRQSETPSEFQMSAHWSSVPE